MAGINIGQIINSISDSDVDGATFAGGLVGVNAGNINNSYATGTVRGNFYYAGGLVGLNVGITANTYAVGDVTGNERVGGLVGDNRNLIAASYAAIGDVTGTRLVGAMVGINSGSITDSYVGQSDESDDDLVGENLPVGTTENSVILVDTTFQSESSIAGWSASNWDFGDQMSYPTLRYDDSLCDSSSDTSRCGLLPNQQYQTGLGALFLVSGGEVLNPDLRLGDQPFSVSQENYSVVIANQSEVQLRPFAINGDDADIRVITAGNEQDYFSGKFSGELSNPIPLGMDSPTTAHVVVTDGDVETRYTLVMTSLGIVTESAAVVDEGDQIILNTTTIGDSYTWSSMPADSVDIPAGSTATLTVQIPDDFVPGGAETTRTTLVFEVNIVDGETAYTLSREFMVNKINNGMPPDITLDLSDSPTTLSIVVGEGTDSDGEGEFSYIWERVYVEGGVKTVQSTVSNSPEYRVPDAAGSNRYRVNVTHTDGQGYVTEYADRESFILQLMRLGMDDDVNDDGLIDIYYLEDLDAIREHLNGIPETCGQNNDEACQGYELQRSLDFDDADSYIEAEVNQAWRSGAEEEGWQPIGIIETPFNAIFTASTDTLSISNLYINRPQEDNIGLFGVIGPQAQILDIHLRDATVIGRYAVGGLVGLTSRLTDSEGSVSESSLIANSSVS